MSVEEEDLLSNEFSAGFLSETNDDGASTMVPIPFLIITGA
eukprot:CAMPEP_0194563090 /NCGR_PEP_ID=MMETSP0292-20121207/3286_1 /TAXON_ID=39354 /ORGANISM="Heterosigma akashiwo, Strain CCMP2393" /LENGTH=40 /DNA_ID= /DNA_START= /DNA_END= /DNA_ORIENTATION=